VSGIDLKIEVIRQRRIQYEVARTANIEPTRLNRILNGWVKPKEEEVAAILTALKIDPLIADSEEQTAGAA
jgi:hypothetical protein